MKREYNGFLADPCDHKWRAVGGEYRTYSRCDVSPDNPVRQAYRCWHCEAVKTEIVRTTP